MKIIATGLDFKFNKTKKLGLYISEYLFILIFSFCFVSTNSFAYIINPVPSNQTSTSNASENKAAGSKFSNIFKDVDWKHISQEDQKQVSFGSPSINDSADENYDENYDESYDENYDESYDESYDEDNKLSMYFEPENNSSSNNLDNNHIFS